ncbi:MAG: aspartyl/asparaginyl beta-hydroxylase domain-containing protein [Novosphingobium sp.]|nr:aspartyl/asparaginyl beta-hydroxylase domain-containing protein [Novosphingobium sp.]
MISHPAEPALNEAAAERRAAADGRDFAALVAKADHRLRADDRRAANAWYGAALRAARSGSAAPAAEIARVETSLARLQRYFTEHMLASLDRAGFPRSQWHQRFAKAMAIMHGERSRDPAYEAYPQLPNSFFYPDLPYVQFADPGGWNWRSAIEHATAAIRGEAEALLGSREGFAPYVRRATARPQGDVHGLVDNPDWRTLDLTQMGEPIPQRVALAPLSFAAIAGDAPLCDIPNRAPSVMFSLLAAGKRIPAHTGMINTRLICHLPLIVPGDGGLRVGNETRRWVEGRLLAFDDSVEHEAWNAADRDRLVLIFDVWRPELEPVERAQIRALFAAVDSA